ncbi:hypothetical protein F5Y04DRAFT_277577 [Hypomontagnella monticulosa]|nr:hypothetical protein F5Y04DRAFT_277577 [Hypomontagnella monticulosa]
MAEPATNPRRLWGYPSLASLMAISYETAIFRKFGMLQMINLLRLQATLQDLEHQYKVVVSAEDRTGSENPMDATHTNAFYMMREEADSGNPSMQGDILEKIGKCLKEYNEALMQVTTISQAQKPRERDINLLREWLRRPDMGGLFLKGIESEIWKEVNGNDFISPANEDIDGFNSLVTSPIINIYHRLYGHNRNEPRSHEIGGSLNLYYHKYINRFANILVAILSSLLPTVMILVLYFINTILWRIGAVIIFTAVFSATLTIFTNAKKVEVYSATAAFAAVEVVFIGSTPLDRGNNTC